MGPARGQVLQQHQQWGSVVGPRFPPLVPGRAKWGEIRKLRCGLAKGGCVERRGMHKSGEILIA